jgi:hypothetical protein
MVSERLQRALSALADGQASAQDWAEVEAAWSRDPELRARWAEIAWIGDGLRSADLLRQRRAEAELIAALPEAPVVGAKQRDWWASAAVAAGFALVALLVPRLRTEDAPAPVLAQPAPTTLSGPSFAQTALGRAPGAWSHLPAAQGVREAGLEVAPPLDFGWPPPLVVSPLPPASQPLRRP